MKTDAQGKTDIGLRRESNQDYFVIDNERGIFIVCDGIGGHHGGEVASQKAIEYTLEYLVEHWSQVEEARNHPIGTFKLNQLVERAIHQACRNIHFLGRTDPALQGMGTTLTLLMIVDGQAFVGHVGDSRLYIKRSNEVFLLTTDHTLYNEMVTEFESVDEVDIRKFRHCLTRSVGNTDTVAVETLSFEARENDVLLLCTDGLSNYFEDETDIAKMLEGGHVNEIANSLVSFANEQGGSDNITALVIRLIDVDDFLVNPHRIRLTQCDNSDVTIEEERNAEQDSRLQDTGPFNRE